MDIVEFFWFLGSIITQDVKWELNISSLITKAQQRIDLMQKLKKLSWPKTIMVQFCTVIIESIFTSLSSIWYAAAAIKDKCILQHIVHSTEKVIGSILPSLLDLYVSRTVRPAGRMIADPSHPGRGLFQSLPFGRRLQSIKSREAPIPIQYLD